MGKITNGAAYTVAAWVRISTDNGTMNMSIEQADENGTQYLNIASGTVTNSGWTQLSVTFTVEILGSVTTFDLYFDGPEMSVGIFVDDVSCFGPAVSSTVTAGVDLEQRYHIMEGFGAAGGWYEG